MAIRACNNPKITSPILSREVSKAVAEHGAREVERRRRIQAAGALVSVSRGGGDTGEDGGGGRKRSRRYSEGAAPVVSPHQDASYFVQQQQQQLPSSDFDQIHDHLFLKEKRSSGSVNRRIRGRYKHRKDLLMITMAVSSTCFLGKLTFYLFSLHDRCYCATG